MKTILLFGAGKSSAVLIGYLLSVAAENSWEVIIADADKEQVLTRTNGSSFAKVLQIDVTNDIERAKLIQYADIVLSLMPPNLHFLIAKDCVAFNKTLLTASYADEKIKALQPEIEKKGLLFICELGLDPGIDHMSAMQRIDAIKADGGKINSFKSHCGGLVSPENDNNPWKYKISWNPRNIVMAGKSGATYKKDGILIQEQYEELFDAARGIQFPELGFLSFYPNRDSLQYSKLYQLQDAATFMRTTLRYPDFMLGWKNVIELKLTDEQKEYETDGLTLMDFFKQHFDKHNFGEWFQQKMDAHLSGTKELLDNLMQVLETEEQAKEKGQAMPENFMMVDEDGDLKNMDIEEIKNKAAITVANQMHEANMALQQLFYLGLDDDKTLINKGSCSAADVLQFALEKKLALQPSDKDMILLLHEIAYEQAGTSHYLQSSLVVKGENNLRTAMAKTVGLPLGIATKLILKGDIAVTGLHIPVIKEIYDPILKELKEQGIEFTDVLK